MTDRSEYPRRLGLLTKHFPPSEEAGALRWQKFSRLAVDYGFDLTVAARRFSELPRRSDAHLRELPTSIRLLEVPTPRTLFDALEHNLIAARDGVLRLMSSTKRAGARHARQPASKVGSISRRDARGALSSLPDLRRAYHVVALRQSELAWARGAAAALKGDPEPLHGIISCGPPHQVHIVGSRLARQLGVPHIIDMRDPWSLVERVPEPFGSRLLWSLSAADEAAAVSSASLVVVNTEAHARVLSETYPRRRERIIAVLNGFDDDPLPPPAPQQPFTIAYAGTIYLDRDPGMLLVPVADLVRRIGLVPQDLQIVFAGDVETTGDRSLDDEVARLGLSDFVQIRGRVSRAEVMRLLATADMNVVLPQDSHLAVPSKVYDYLRFHAWMLALAEPQSATAQTLRGTGADVVDPRDQSAVCEVIGRRLEQRRSSGRPEPLAHSSLHLSRRSQADVLFQRLAQVIS